MGFWPAHLVTSDNPKLCESLSFSADVQRKIREM